MSRQRELNFLIACAAPAISFDPARVVALAQDLNWSSIEALAGYHRARPLLFRRALAHNVVPQPLRSDWEAAFRENAIRNMQFAGDLIAITRALNAARVHVLPHKGPLLALAAYGDLALREFADLDLLVPPQMLRDALAVLAEHGYLRDPDLAWLSSSALRRWTGETSCESTSGVPVDLHWRLTPSHYPVQLDPAILWRHKEALTVAGTAVPTLAPEALLVLLAVHGAKHCWETIGWLADLAWLVQARPAFNWNLAFDLGIESGCARPLLLATALIRDVFATLLPDQFTSGIEADPEITRLRKRVMARWVHGEMQSPRSPELLSFAAALSPRRAATLRHLIGLVLHPTERDWRTRRLPEDMFFLYAPSRLGRLARKYASPQNWT